MQLNAVTKTWGSGRQAWLGSAHATNEARTVTIDVTKLTAFEKKTIPSGTPLKKGANGKYEPVTAAGDELAGFLLTEQYNADGKTDVIAPMIWHGRIRSKYLPEGAFAVATLTTPNPQFTIEED